MSKKRSDPPRPAPESLHLPLTGADSHAHLDLPEFADTLHTVLERARRSGVARIGHVFSGPEAYRAHRENLAPFPELFFLMAVHPCDAATCTGNVMSAMREAFRNDPRLRAVGETGLDFYWKDCPPFIQETVFRMQLELARQTDRPVVIHSRDAAADTLRILEAEQFCGRPVLWHCFSGDATTHLDRILANGWHISLGGPLTYPANQQLRDAAARCPLDRLLLETDAPYLAPVPWRGKTNEPALSVFTAQTAAEVRGMEPAALWTACGDNCRRFFGLEH